MEGQIDTQVNRSGLQRQQRDLGDTPSTVVFCWTFWVRDLDSDESRVDRADMAKELGDVLWYVAVLADYLDLPLDDVATANLAKLASRQSRGLLGGNGDNR